MSETGLALKIGSLVLGLGTYLVLFKQIKGLKKHGWSGLFYILGVSFIISLSTLLLLIMSSAKEVTAILIAQAYIIIIGILHVAFGNKLIKWYSRQAFGAQLTMIISILLFSYFFFSLSFTFLVDSNARLIWQMSLLWFLVPVLLNQTINKLLEVPPKNYKKWQYPVGLTIDDPTDEEMENPVVISFVFKKSPEEQGETTFRAKAPSEMTLGRLFYFFIDDYNGRHPEAPISIVDEGNNPDNWNFFKIKNKFLNLKNALDPDITISENRIRENDVLICNRVDINENLKQDETIEQ